MSYAESEIHLSEAETALASGRYNQAAGRYATVVSELAPEADAIRPLRPADVPLIRHYAAASRGQSAALTQLGDVAGAEKTLLAVLSRLRGCISNLGTPATERAPLLTEYKLCFYALSELYFADKQLTKLADYARRHAPELKRWADDLQLVRASHDSN